MSIMWKYARLLLIMLAFAIIAGSLLQWLVRLTGPTWPGKYKVIRQGMSEDEVWAVIGMPAANYFSAGCQVGGFEKPYVILEVQSGLALDEVPTSWWSAPAKEGNGYVKHWAGERRIILVAFNEQGAAVGWYLYKIDLPTGASDFNISRIFVSE